MYATQSLHVVVTPLTTAFYNIVALLGLYPFLEQKAERKMAHHLRCVTILSVNVRFICMCSLASSQTKLLSYVLKYTLFVCCRYDKAAGNSMERSSVQDPVADRRRARALKVSRRYRKFYFDATNMPILISRHKFCSLSYWMLKWLSWRNRILRAGKLHYLILHFVATRYRNKV